MKKRFILLIFVLLLETSFSGVANARISVVSTIFPSFDFARCISGELADVSMLLPVGVDAHDFEPTPRDLIKIQNCSLFIYTGGENDVWIEKLLSSLGNKRPHVLRLLDCVADSEIDSLNVEETRHESSHREEAHTVDEHVWTSPIYSIMIVERITDKMSELDPDSAFVFQANSLKLKSELEELDSEFYSVVNSSSRKYLLFASRFPFIYFARRYGLTYDSAFSGCSTETEPSASTLAYLTNRAIELKLPVILTMEMSNTKMAETICELTGAKCLTLNSGHGVTSEQMKKGIRYTDIMRDNLEVLKEALN